MNIFDSIQDVAFDITTGTFGYTATWLPLDNSPEQVATVHYKDATAKEEIDASDYNIPRYFIEYKNINFIGLFESSAQANNEKVKIELTAGLYKDFWVKRCEKLFDGKTIKAFLIPA